MDSVPDGSGFARHANNDQVKSNNHANTLKWTRSLPSSAIGAGLEWSIVVVQ